MSAYETRSCHTRAFQMRRLPHMTDKTQIDNATIYIRAWWLCWHLSVHFGTKD